MRPTTSPARLSSMWRLFKLGYHHEPRLLVTAFVLSLLAAVPDALIALWLALLGKGAVEGNDTLVMAAAIGLGVSATLTWLLRVISSRLQRRFRDQVTIALEAHVAGLQARVVTVAHQERPDYLDRLAVLRDQIFVLDHLYMSVFSTCGWILRLAVTVVLLMSIDWTLALLVLAALPTVLTSGWRPGVERRVQEEVGPAPAPRRALLPAGHHRAVGARAPRAGAGGAGREPAGVRPGSRWYAPTARRPLGQRSVAHRRMDRLRSGVTSLAVVWVTVGLDAPSGRCCSCSPRVDGCRGTSGRRSGEIGFLRGVWLDGSRRLAWLEDYAAAPAHRRPGAAGPADPRGSASTACRSPTRAPATGSCSSDVDLDLPRGVVVAVVGENGAGKSTLVKLLAQMYVPTAGRILVDGVPLADIDPEQWRDRVAGAFQDFFRFELRGPAVRRRRRPAPARRPGRRVGAAVGRAGADDVVAPARGRAGDPARAALARRRRPLVRPVAEGRPRPRLHARRTRCCSCSTSPPPRSTPRPSTRCSSGSRPRPGLETRSDGRVTVLVSHRFSTVRMADLIVVLDGAQVVEVGSHDELMARAGQATPSCTTCRRPLPLTAAGRDGPTSDSVSRRRTARLNQR